ncbi:subtilisin-like protein [Diplogelasinospora grovesii]|uniref:Subtilisin-like protein n=1 Tax=Diplogelasinospora grovesii TaxID=303347 RepID=A0AAN6N340_9PEZI|nr:subtilisin-like protein [Diplogelasinospora grovesii]
MKLSILLFGVSAFIGSALADAVVVNDGVTKGVIPEEYIVVYKADADKASRRKHQDNVDSIAKKRKKGGVKQTFEGIPGFTAYTVQIAQEDLPTILKSNVVKYVEKNTAYSLSMIDSTPARGNNVPGANTVVDAAVNASTGVTKRYLVNQPTAYSWGLTRISHKYRSAATNYIYDTSAGFGTRVYVVDSGIMTTHQEFGGRATFGANFVTGSPNTDEFGHGTHVAGTVGGHYIGVAKATNLIAVKVLDKNGAAYGGISTMYWGTYWAAVNALNAGKGSVSVINISLHVGVVWQAWNDLITAITNAGVTVVVAAGNDNRDARLDSPSSTPSAITVGATDSTDSKAVDLFAPGVSILSSYPSCTTCYQYMSGTSMASPHVAGLAVYFMAKDNIKGVVGVTNRILSLATNGLVINNMGAPNKLAYNGDGY